MILTVINKYLEQIKKIFEELPKNSTRSKGMNSMIYNFIIFDNFTYTSSVSNICNLDSLFRVHSEISIRDTKGEVYKFNNIINLNNHDILLSQLNDGTTRFWLLKEENNKLEMRVAYGNPSMQFEAMGVVQKKLIPENPIERPLLISIISSIEETKGRREKKFLLYHGSLMDDEYVGKTEEINTHNEGVSEVAGLDGIENVAYYGFKGSNAITLFDLEGKSKEKS